jgi:hypothetical protein
MDTLTTELPKTLSDKICFACLCLIPFGGIAGFAYLILLSEARNKGSLFPNPATGQTSILETPIRGAPHTLVYVTHFHMAATIVAEWLMMFFVAGFFVPTVVTLLIVRFRVHRMLSDR